MEAYSTDRRIRKTRDLIKQALIKLLFEKDLKDITVSELTGLADINRGTFYLHYKDVPDLFSQIEDEILEEFSRYIVKYKNHSELLRMPVLGDFFQYIVMNKDVCRALIRSRDSTLLVRIIDLSRPRTKAEYRQYYQNWNEEYYNYYYDFICSGSIAMLRRWLESGMKESVEQVALMAEKMISHCIENFRG
ncbi:MAG: TetR family transcriptional regulator C-terminal domain-containing protein [Treponema sp.]|jgi:AcrR family transcriptional regulator|nr:TetR family transcriptional regulator C-terminal domain-containing protein [Treponema sp.]